METGLTLLSDHHYLGATADGLINDTILEIKCPFSGKDKTIAELVSSGYKHLLDEGNGKWQLKKSSHYYSQVQGEMAIKHCSNCHFVVWTPLDMAIIAVQFDENFWLHQLLPKLKSFFALHIEPKLLAQDK
jgi:hypothetical protein